MDTRCHHCDSSSYRRNGSSKGVQRYICKGCGRSFTSARRRYDRSVKEKALQMYLNNVGIRKIALFTGASPAGVLKWIRKAGESLSRRLREAADKVESEYPDVIEMDEIYTYVKKNGSAQSSGLLILDGKVVLLRLR